MLTGFSFNSTGLPAEVAGTQAGPAAQVDPSRFNGLDQTYLLFNSSAGYQLIFFFTPNFVPSVQQATYTNRQTVTIGELITMSSLSKPATSFTGPVLIIDGEVRSHSFASTDARSTTRSSALETAGLASRPV